MRGAWILVFLYRGSCASALACVCRGGQRSISDVIPQEPSILGFCYVIKVYYMCFACMYVHMCAMCVPDAHGGKERVLGHEHVPDWPIAPPP